MRLISLLGINPFGVVLEFGKATLAVFWTMTTCTICCK